MKSFRFNLQSLLTLRQRQERTIMENYAQTLLARHRAIEAFDAIHRELAAVWSRSSAELMEGSRADDVLRLHFHSCGLDEERRRRETAVGTAERAANLALGKLLASRQARKMVDQHRDHQRAEHDRASNRAEQKILDDLVTRRIAPIQNWQGARTN